MGCRYPRTSEASAQACQKPRAVAMIILLTAALTATRAFRVIVDPDTFGLFDAVAGAHLTSPCHGDGQADRVSPSLNRSVDRFAGCDPESMRHGRAWEAKMSFGMRE